MRASSSGSRTTTQTLPPATPPLVLHLRAAPTLMAMAAKLTAIFETYKGLTDPTSRELTTLGGRICQLILSHSLKNETTLRQLAAMVHELRTILRNFFDDSPLQKPTMVRGRLWEEWMLEHNKTLGGLSPLDKQPLEEGSPYLYGQQLLEWQEELFTLPDTHAKQMVKALLQLRTQEDSSGWLNPEITKNTHPTLARKNYRFCAKRALETENHRRETAAIIKIRDNLQATIQTVEERTTHHGLQLRNALTEMERMQTRHTTLLEKTYERAIGDVTRLLKLEEKDNRHLEVRLQSSERNMHRLQNQLSDINMRHNQLAAENQANRNAINDDGGCVVM